ncbi:LysR family transcriptional regulator [Lichenicola cladoniae]|uniref:LysR family transcriptional regulator n=1 Tax=Lichenicola cladoniae TaxID=1484109 RepID=A0A6M8HHQ0_9PROT|nr:LysR substrate-binding domain-containing protein [Lichenicola cladoniae]NPD65294.1 LysR family transcriptional regulator [Acetobacteraceae bacterium]QKE88879.1 LysR family transcriptional regulator [Lichenicola cladoniae]
MAQHHLSGLSLRDLDYAVALAELRHFGRAAERCGVSQPALSEQIRKLEAVLGTPLFERGRGGVSPTPRGQLLLRQITVVVREARGLLAMARSQVGALEGGLDLGVIPTLGPYYVPLVLRDLRQEFPRLVLRLQENRTTLLLDALSRFSLDAALIALPVDRDGLSVSPIFFEPFRVLLPAGHALAEVSSLDVATLDADDLLLLEEGHCLRDQAVSLCRRPKQVATDRSALSSPITEPRFATSLEMLRHMVAAGEGFSLMPALATREVSELSGLVRLRPLTDPAAGRTIGLVWRASDPRTPDFERLAEALRSTAPDDTEPARWQAETAQP